MQTTDAQATVNLTPARITDRAEVDGCEIVAGYLWHVTPDSEDALKLGEDEQIDDYTISAPHVGYHGLDTPPSAAEWVADDGEQNGGYLVVTRDPEPPVCVEGWTAEPAEVDTGDSYNDGTCETVIVHADRERDGARKCVVSMRCR